MDFKFPDKKSAKEMISVAFRSLRKQGFRARANFMCCSSCACAALDGSTASGQPWVYYTKQDNDSLVALPSRGGRNGCYLTWGVKDGSDYAGRDSSAGEKCPADLRSAAEAICAAMQDAGLVVEWKGQDPAIRIWVQHPNDAAAEADAKNPSGVA